MNKNQVINDEMENEQEQINEIYLEIRLNNYMNSIKY